MTKPQDSSATRKEPRPDAVDVETRASPTTTSPLDFELPVIDLERRVAELRELSERAGADGNEDAIAALEEQAKRRLKEIYSTLTPWQRTLTARRPDRPRFQDYAQRLLKDFTPLRGDRRFADDEAIEGGPAFLRGNAVMVLGQERGGDTQSRVKRNFGMARPEGYRKATRLIKLAERFALPIVTFVDTPGAYPGVGAEERGQAEAIAACIEAMGVAEVPVISTILGEGGSGGAMALAVADRVNMLEHSVYGVISPEGAASILWRDAARAEDAAKAMQAGAQDLLKRGVIDEVIDEPIGGAHRDPEAAIDAVGDAIEKFLTEARKTPPAEGWRERRRKRFAEIGRN